MTTFTYFDNAKQVWKIAEDGKSGAFVSPILFQCQAESIVEADKLFEVQTGLNPVKLSKVGCTVKDV